jgi:ABC-type glutathione transport system ATPase component
VVAGISRPDRGRVAARRRIGALLDPNAGFDPVLTGRENLDVAYTLATGHRPSPEVVDAVVAYADLAAVMDAPLRTYSKGMRLRLSFSLMIHADPDVLLIDEALAVGDTGFQLRCLEQLAAYCRAGGAVLFVSHSLWLFQHLATRGIHLVEGRVAADGAPHDVADRYLADLQGGSWVDVGDAPDVLERERAMAAPPPGPPPEGEGGGAAADDAAGPAPGVDVVDPLAQRPVRIRRVTVEGVDAAPHAGEPALLEVEVEATEPIGAAEWAFTVWTADNSVCVVGDLSRDVAGGSATGDFDLPVGTTVLRYRTAELPLAPGRYVVKVAIYDGDTGDVAALHGYEDAPTWFEVTGAADGAAAAAGLRPLRTIGAEWSHGT